MTRVLVAGGNRRVGTRSRLTPVGNRLYRACHESLAPARHDQRGMGAGASADRRRAGKFLTAIPVEQLTPLRQSE